MAIWFCEESDHLHLLAYPVPGMNNLWDRPMNSHDTGSDGS